MPNLNNLQLDDLNLMRKLLCGSTSCQKHELSSKNWIIYLMLTNPFNLILTIFSDGNSNPFLNVLKPD